MPLVKAGLSTTSSLKRLFNGPYSFSSHLLYRKIKTGLACLFRHVPSVSNSLEQGGWVSDGFLGGGMKPSHTVSSSCHEVYSKTRGWL